MTPDELTLHFGEMVDAAGLPRWSAEQHRPDIQVLELTWPHGATFHFDLAGTTADLEPLDEGDRRHILDIPLWGDANHPAIYLDGTGEWVEGPA